MNFISNILKVTYNIHVILYFSSFRAGKKYFKELSNDDLVIFTPTTLKFGNGNRVSLIARDKKGLSLCGERANIVVTDIDEQDLDFKTQILPLVTCSRDVLISGIRFPDTKFKNFVYNPVINKIICNKAYPKSSRNRIIY